jgi:Centromere-binding protein ParB C-terminal
MNRPGPAPERGGTPNALDAVRKRGGLTKARNTSVIADMTRMADEPAADPQPATLYSVPTAAADPGQAPASAAPASAQVPTEAPQVQHASIVDPSVVQQPTPQQAPDRQPQPVAYVPQVQPVQPAPQQVQALLRQPAPEPSEPEKKKYRKTSFFQSKESGARMRSAYIATRHLTGYRTLSDFILAAVEREVGALERQYNGGNLFTADPGTVPRGRPLET